jgi:hypothetical protein
MDDKRRPPEYHLELTADRPNIKDVTKALLHTIFFHRYFTPLNPATHEILDLTLPYMTEDSIDALIDTRTTTLLRALDTSPTAHIQLQFLERRRRRGWFSAKPDEELPWETWVVHVAVTAARSEPEAFRNRRAMAAALERACWSVVEVVNRERAHIPPITSNESNPFPYHVVVGKGKGPGVVEKGWF